MRRLFVAFFALALFIVNFSCYASNGGGSINWQTNYAEAIREANVTGKPLVLFFTGSDWCTWCVRLEQEILHTKEFGDAAGPDFVFVKLDFPTKTMLDPRITQQNKDLQQKYHVNSFPTIIVIDAHGRQLGSPMGYKQNTTPAQYAQLLRGLVGNVKPVPNQ